MTLTRSRTSRLPAQAGAAAALGLLLVATSLTPAWAASSPPAGTYTGENDYGYSVEFTVGADGTLTEFETTSTCTVYGMLSQTIVMPWPIEHPPVRVQAGEPFSVEWSIDTDTAGASSNFTFAGVIAADGTATGTGEAGMDLPVLNCAANDFTWSASTGGVTPEPSPLPAPKRLAGENRYATSVAISERSFPSAAPVVYLASGTSFPDGLAAGPAAAHQGGPVLLTQRDTVSQAVLDEIERLDPETVVIVGGTPSVSAGALQQVRALDSTRTIERLGGENRYETSRLIADYAFDSADAAFVATGTMFPDALASGPAAAHLDGPVLLVRGSTSAADAATLATLDALGVDWVGIAGDANSVSAGIATGLDRAVGDVERFAGANRYETAALIGAVFDDADTVLVASGLGFADALAGAAAAGTAGAPMLLARTGCMPQEARTALNRWTPSEVVLLGGTPTLSAAVAAYRSC